MLTVSHPNNELFLQLFRPSVEVIYLFEVGLQHLRSTEAQLRNKHPMKVEYLVINWTNLPHNLKWALPLGQKFAHGAGKEDQDSLSHLEPLLPCILIVLLLLPILCIMSVICSYPVNDPQPVPQGVHILRASPCPLHLSPTLHGPGPTNSVGNAHISIQKGHNSKRPEVPPSLQIGREELTGPITQGPLGYSSEAYS